MDDGVQQSKNLGGGVLGGHDTEWCGEIPDHGEGLEKGVNVFPGIDDYQEMAHVLTSIEGQEANRLAVLNLDLRMVEQLLSQSVIGGKAALLDDHEVLPVQIGPAELPLVGQRMAEGDGDSEGLLTEPETDALTLAEHLGIEEANVDVDLPAQVLVHQIYTLRGVFKGNDIQAKLGIRLHDPGPDVQKAVRGCVEGFPHMDGIVL